MCAQPKLQRTWLRQGNTRRKNQSLDRVKSASKAKTPSPLNKPLGVRKKQEFK